MREGLPHALHEEALARAAAAERFSNALGERLTKDAVGQALQRAADVAGHLQVSGAQAVLALRPQVEQADLSRVFTSLRAADVNKLDARALKSGVGTGCRVLGNVCDGLVVLLGKIESEIAGRLAAAGVDPAVKEKLVHQLSADVVGIGESLARYQDANR
jgi:hypothetical protein